MVHIEYKTNFGFFLIFVGLILLAFIEGKNIDSALNTKDFITGSEIHLIGFIVLTLFMLIVALFKPEKELLVAFSAITLSLIIILTTFYDTSIKQVKINMVIYLLSSVILIIGGVIIAAATRSSNIEKDVIKRAINHYKK